MVTEMRFDAIEPLIHFLPRKYFINSKCYDFGGFHCAFFVGMSSEYST